MVDFLSQPFFVYFVIPVVTVVLVGLFRFATYKDGMSFDKRDFFAAYFDIMLSSTLLLATSFTERVITLGNTTDPTARQAITASLLPYAWYMLGFVVSIFCVSLFVRKLGWNGNNQLRIWTGIVIPDVVSLGFLFWAMIIVGR